MIFLPQITWEEYIRDCCDLIRDLDLMCPLFLSEAQDLTEIMNQIEAELHETTTVISSH
jgi:hypothetical protein